MTHTQNPLLQPYAGHSPKDTASLVWGGVSLALLVAALCSDSVILIIAALLNAELAVRAMTRVGIEE